MAQPVKAAPEFFNADYLRRRKSISMRAPRPASAKEEGSGTVGRIIPANVYLRGMGASGGVVVGLPVAVVAMADSPKKVLGSPENLAATAASKVA